MSPDRMPIADIATDQFWDAFASADFADTIAVDPSDVATIRYLHTRSAWPAPSPEFAVRLRRALLTIGTADAAVAASDELPLLLPGDQTPKLPLPMPVVAPIEHRRGRLPILAAAAVLALLLTGLALWQFDRDDNSPASIPAVAPPLDDAASSDVSAIPVMPRIDLPVELVPWSAFGINLDHRSMPPVSQSDDANDDSLKLRYLISGTVTARSDGHLRVLRGNGDGVWEEVIPGSPVELRGGDAVFVDDGAPISFVNDESSPAEFISWSLFPKGSSPSEGPPGWTIHVQDSWHITSVAEPDAPVRLRLERIELEPAASIEPPRDAMVHQLVYLPINAAGERVAPMIGTLPDGGSQNMGRQALTVYELVIEPAKGNGA